MKTSSPPVIIVVEDDAAQREETVLALQLAGMTAFGVPDGPTLDQLMSVHNVDLVVLDIRLPGESGLQIASRLQALSTSVGLVMLAGKSALHDRVQGLTIGADAYLGKPVDPQELVATIQAVRRRLQKAGQALAVATAAPRQIWRVSDGGRLISYGKQTDGVKLTELQRLLLACFNRVPVGHVVRREVLMQALGHDEQVTDVHRLETLISRLRQKVRSQLGRDLPLAAVASQGYALSEPVTFEAS